MQEQFSNFWQSVLQFSEGDAVDILLVALIVYALLVLTKETRAIQVLKGMGFILIAARLAMLANLTAISQLMSSLIGAGAVMIAVVFQPELRKALEQLGRGKFLRSKQLQGIQDNSWIVAELHSAILRLSKRKVGALVVIERKTGLSDIAETGTNISGRVSSALVENIFEPNTPLHDGAMIVNGSEIVAAGCFLPLSDNKDIGKDLGTRHRAALGVAEISDSLTIIVSEETGIISIAEDGRLIRHLSSQMLKKTLERVIVDESDQKAFSFFRKRFRGKNGVKT